MVKVVNDFAVSRAMQMLTPRSLAHQVVGVVKSYHPEF